jgi:hypothetical protein
MGLFQAKKCDYFLRFIFWDSRFGIGSGGRESSPGWEKAIQSLRLWVSLKHLDVARSRTKPTHRKERDETARRWGTHVSDLGHPPVFD